LLQQAEVERIEREVRPWLRDVVTVLALTGMRIGELINLKWKDVDLDQKLMHVRIRDDWRPKGKADRTIQMHPKVAAIIKRAPRRPVCILRSERRKAKGAALP
jgi:integrase